MQKMLLGYLIALLAALSFGQGPGQLQANIEVHRTLLEKTIYRLVDAQKYGIGLNGINLTRANLLTLTTKTRVWRSPAVLARFQLWGAAKPPSGFSWFNYIDPILETSVTIDVLLVNNEATKEMGFYYTFNQVSIEWVPNDLEGLVNAGLQILQDYTPLYNYQYGQGSFNLGGLPGTYTMNNIQVPDAGTNNARIGFDVYFDEGTGAVVEAIAFPGPRRSTVSVSTKNRQFQSFAVTRYGAGGTKQIAVYHPLDGSYGSGRYWYPLIHDEGLSELDASGIPITYTYKVEYLGNDGATKTYSTTVEPGVHVYQKDKNLPAGAVPQFSPYITYVSSTSGERRITRLEEALQIVNDLRGQHEEGPNVVRVHRGTYDVAPSSVGATSTYVPSNTILFGDGTYSPGYFRTYLNLSVPLLCGSGVSGGTVITGFYLDGQNRSPLLTLFSGPMIHKKVCRNIFIRSAGTALTIHPTVPGSPTEPTVLVQNNTFVYNQGHGIELTDNPAPPATVIEPTITQNIFAFNQGYGIAQPSNALPSAGANDFWGNAGAVLSGGVPGTATQFPGYDNTNLSQDPLFFSAQNNAFSLYDEEQIVIDGHQFVFPNLVQAAKMGAFAGEYSLTVGHSPVSIMLVTAAGETLSDKVNQLGEDASFIVSATGKPESDILPSDSGTAEDRLRQDMLEYLDKYPRSGDATKIVILRNPILEPSAYSLYITPTVDAKDGDTYSIIFTQHGTETYLANNEPVPTTGKVIEIPFDESLIVRDMAPPTRPRNFMAEIQGAGVYLNWSSNSDVDIARYLIYRSEVSPVALSDGNQIANLDSGVNEFVDLQQAGFRGFYALVAVDRDGQKSPSAQTSPSYYVYASSQNDRKSGDGSRKYPYSSIRRAAQDADKYVGKPFAISLFPGTYRERLNYNFPSATRGGDAAFTIGALYDQPDSMPVWIGDGVACLELQNQAHASIKGIWFETKGESKGAMRVAVLLKSNVENCSIERCYFLGKALLGRIDQGVRAEGQMSSINVVNSVFFGLGTGICDNTSRNSQMRVVNSTFYRSGFAVSVTGDKDDSRNGNLMFGNNLAVGAGAGYLLSASLKEKGDATIANCLVYGYDGIIATVPKDMNMVLRDTLTRDPLLASTDSTKPALAGFMQPTLAEAITGGMTGDSFPCTDFFGEYRGSQITIGAVEGVPSVPNSASKQMASGAAMRLPMEFALLQNYPNPFNPVTSIRFQVPGILGEQLLQIQLQVYDARGRLVRSLIQEPRTAGKYVVTWDGKNGSGGAVPSGLYFYRLRAGQFGAVRKMILLK